MHQRPAKTPAAAQPPVFPFFPFAFGFAAVAVFAADDDDVQRRPRRRKLLTLKVQPSEHENDFHRKAQRSGAGSARNVGGAFA